MQWCTSVLIVLVLGLCLESEAFPGVPHCNSAEIEEDPKMARFCSALSTFLELYAEAGQVPINKPSADYQAFLREYPNLLDTNMKRQDVVHNFLRFGRRRR